MPATLIPIALIIGFAVYLLYCWWADKKSPSSPTAIADEVHFNPHLYVHAKQICGHKSMHKE
ncbi:MULTISPECIES: hypothetical protein [Deefgea]|uniref:Uncharacterized protein n=1 Tax=Deefgea chitinilytica TaxID=570276 RepID=A0ABS2CB77_9NEIS|nr:MULTISPECIES: hypothetical protein [Deefgea]MBM5571412.1 hypothetical protein [Deefgea chitinilytica]MBM9888645.1 hypothetical protein [Deefgea sp. CFH1-16]